MAYPCAEQQYGGGGILSDIGIGVLSNVNLILKETSIILLVVRTSFLSLNHPRYSFICTSQNGYIVRYTELGYDQNRPRVPTMASVYGLMFIRNL